MRSLIYYAKYPIWTVLEYFRHPVRAFRNTDVVLAAFFRTVLVGRKMVKVIRRHKSYCSYLEKRSVWMARMRGKFVWRAARKIWAQWILERAGITVSVVGESRINWKESHIIVANHQSTIDPIILVKIVPNGRYVAKKEICSYPIIGHVARESRQIIVDRSNHSQAMKAIREGLDDYSDCNLIFFAEGTRTKTGYLGEFKKGAFAIARQAGLPVVPVAISGAYEALSKGSLLRLRRNSHIRVEFGHPINPKEAGPVNSLIQKAHIRICLMLAGNYSDHLFAPFPYK